ncbi:MAG: T9SS type A sorting domain-containing protein [Bacteroidetes bacterium]|nr:MAG: T9SS type A sorting domain-containing protein [Bacteroidota bacterium]
MMKNRPVQSNKYQISRGALAVFSCLLSSSSLLSQEVLTDLTTNPVITKKYSQRQTSSDKHQFTTLDTIQLPFLDDFSKEDIYPDAALWLDSNIYINRDYPIQPPTLGAATFDGVSKSGCPYDTTLTNNGASLPADILTSKPINLALIPADSVYLTFYWQAEGRGNDPEASDTLLLDFFNPTTQLWANIWYKKGYNPSSSDTVFRLVSIPITDPAYLKNAFQFRFRNKATISGNVDHWHIDYVLLDKNRNMGDTIFSDVAFAYNCRSLLKNYYAMPWRQYQASEMKTNLDFFIRNNDTIQKNTSFDYEIYDNTGGTEATYSGGSNNCKPYITDGYWDYPPISNPQIGTTPYSYPTLTDIASFSIECALGTTLNDKDKWNDTLRFKQNFHNYYAYDDGTMEAGYGLNVYGGQMAYKFSLNTQDTLVAVQMLFNWIAPKVSYRQFKIRVWADAGGIPGTVIYEDTLVSPKYQYQFHDDWGNLTNMFYPYKLTTPQPLSGIFYVGLVQYCCNGNNELLNIGYDKNTNSASKMFYDAGNGWTPTALAQKGSWMIRPVFGDTAGVLSVQENIISSFKIFPNPSNGQFKVQSKMADVRWQMADVYNVFGEKIYSVINSSDHSFIDLNDKSNGIYFLRITDEKGATHSQKLILTK